MDNIEKRIKGFVKLGEFLGQFTKTDFHEKAHVAHNDLFFEPFKDKIALARQKNGWFTRENIGYALTQWSDLLKAENLHAWLGRYPYKEVSPRQVAVIMAGNIPLAGFHDFLSVLLTGHAVTVKLSSADEVLLPFLAWYLEQAEPYFKGKIDFTREPLRNFDAVIATGSNNTARYFDYYFGKKPNIIRRNRNSAGVLSGNESTEQLAALGEDIFTYYGLGCRNVSKLFVPEDYDFSAFFKAIYSYHLIINHEKYANNYDYNKAVYLMSSFAILENGFLMLKEDESYAAPIATVFYEYYDNYNTLKAKLEADSDKIQCIVAGGFKEEEVPFGKSQQPRLWEYADGVDTVDFLLKI